MQKCIRGLEIFTRINKNIYRPTALLQLEIKR